MKVSPIAFIRQEKIEDGMLARRIRHESGPVPERKQRIERRPQRLPESVMFPSPRPACALLLSTLSLSADLFAFGESGREDSNLQPPEPHIAGLSHEKGRFFRVFRGSAFLLSLLCTRF